MKKHGYEGASEISKRITRILRKATTREFLDIFDDIARTL